MALDPRTQGDARTKKHAEVCKGGLPTKLAGKAARKRACAEFCECWCHPTFTNPDGSEREDADALRAEIRRLSLESMVLIEMIRSGRMS